MTIADILSVGTVIDFEGKSYEIRDLNQLEQGRYQRWLESRAREAVDREQQRDEDWRDRQHDRVSTNAAAGLYSWRGPVATAAMQTRDGVMKFLEVLCGIDADTAARLYDNRLGQILAVLRAALEEDPKKVREALRSLGLPPDFLDAKKPKKPRSSGSAARRSTKRKSKSRR